MTRVLSDAADIARPISPAQAHVPGLTRSPGDPLALARLSGRPDLVCRGGTARAGHTLLTIQSSKTNRSMSPVTKLRTASAGDSTMGSPRMLNEVFSSMGMPV